MRRALICVDGAYCNVEKTQALARRSTYAPDGELRVAGAYPSWGIYDQLERFLGHKITQWDLPRNAVLCQLEAKQYASLGAPLNTCAGASTCWLGLLCLDGEAELTLGDETRLRLRCNRLVLFPAQAFRVDAALLAQLFCFAAARREIGADYQQLYRQHQRYVVAELLTLDECAELLAAAQRQPWTTNRHDRYPTTDIPLASLECGAAVEQRLRERVLPLLEQHFGFSRLAFRDLFVVKYSADAQRELALHRDVSQLSFNVLLNEASEFDGGGTYFERLDQTVQLRRGQVLLHSGRLRHAGRPVTRGERYILVGFVTVDSDRFNPALDAATRKRSVSDDEAVRLLFSY